jgi:hypothetical protein
MFARRRWHFPGRLPQMPADQILPQIHDAFNYVEDGRPAALVGIAPGPANRPGLASDPTGQAMMAHLRLLGYEPESNGVFRQSNAWA